MAKSPPKLRPKRQRRQRTLRLVSGTITLLGPQPEFRSLRAILKAGKLEGKLATVTAGWEEDEQDDAALNAAIALPVINLSLFHRTEQIFHDDPEVIGLLQRRQDELRHLREVYRFRLERYLDTFSWLTEFRDDLVSFEQEKVSSLQVVRDLDREYLLRTTDICQRYDDCLRLDERPSIQVHVAELKQILGDVAALVILGGHAAIILNRLRIFGLLRHCTHLPIVACAAGAMALAEQLVFFHDALPQGAVWPELLRAGMNQFPDVLPLPDGTRRLRLADKTRVSLFAQRFAPLHCVILGPNDWLHYAEGVWSASPSAQRLGVHGELEKFPG